MSVYHQDDTVTLHHGDCLDVLAALPDASVDAVVTDPPYGLANTDPAHVAETITRWVNGERDYLPGGSGFMGATWDAFVPPVAVWDECLRVLKPGGHVLTFAGSRTVDLMTLGLRLAGFEIRDSIAWLYGSGFPKSLDVSKAIDKMDATEERANRAREFQAWLRQYLTPQQVNDATETDMGHHLTTHPTQPAVATAGLFDRLRPLLPEVPERIEALVTQRTVESENFKARAVTGSAVMVDTSRSRLGFAGDTYGGDSSSRVVDLTAAHTPEAQQWTGWGTALKPAFEPIVVARKPLAGTVAANVLEHGTGALNIAASRIGTDPVFIKGGGAKYDAEGNKTFLPSEEVNEWRTGRWPTNVVLDDTQAAVLDEQSGASTSRVGKPRGAEAGDGWGMTATGAEYDDTGGASRFFPTFRYEAKAPQSERPKVNGTAHPTVKPLDLMRWLVRLVTPPGGTVLEPFAGSGTTVEACVVEGFKCIAIEKTDEYLPLTVARIHRRRDPVAAIKLAGDDLGLFDLGDTP